MKKILLFAIFIASTAGCKNHIKANYVEQDVIIDLNGKVYCTRVIFEGEEVYSYYDEIINATPELKLRRKNQATNVLKTLMNDR